MNIILALISFWQKWIIKTANAIVGSKEIDYAAEATRKAQETTKANFIALAIDGAAALTIYDATIDINTTSTQAGPINNCADDLQNKIEQQFWNMAKNGNCYVFLDVRNGVYSHIYLDNNRVKPIRCVGDKILEADVILDYKKIKDNIFFLVARHNVADNGDTTIIYRTTDSEMNDRPSLWDISDKIYYGANHILFGTYKSPVNSRGLYPYTGVGLGFGCDEQLEWLRQDLDNIAHENKQGKSKLFAYGKIARTKDKNTEIPDDIYVVDKRDGTSGSLIDIFSPGLRNSIYWDDFYRHAKLFDKQAGFDYLVSAMFMTGGYDNELKINVENALTKSTIKKFQNALSQGIQDTLLSDSIQLGIPTGLFEVTTDFFDIFENPQTAWERLRTAVTDGAAEKWRETQWLFPTMSKEEAQEEIVAAKAEQQTAVDLDIEGILNNRK